MRRGGIFAILSVFFDGVKDTFTPKIPAENWANKDLINQDRMNGMSEKEILKNVERGRYIVTKKYPEPHRNENGQILIENCQLWHEDLNKYGSVQVGKWVEQGKYNLTPEEAKVENARIRLNLLKQMHLGAGTRIRPEEEIEKKNCEKILSESTIDFTQTEAIKAWTKARNVDLSCNHKDAKAKTQTQISKTLANDTKTAQTKQKDNKTTIIKSVLCVLVCFIAFAICLSVEMGKLGMGLLLIGAVVLGCFIMNK